MQDNKKEALLRLLYLTPLLMNRRDADDDEWDCSPIGIGTVVAPMLLIIRLPLPTP